MANKGRNHLGKQKVLENVLIGQYQKSSLMANFVRSDDFTG